MTSEREAVTSTTPEAADKASGNLASGHEVSSSLRRVAPFAAAGVCAIVTLALTDVEIGGLPALGSILGAGALLSLMATFGGALRRGAAALAPLAALGLVGLLLHANGGATSGLLPLVVVPLMWVALYRGRLHLVVCVTMLALILVLPLVGTDAAVSDVRRGVLSIVVAALLGWVTQGLVMRVRAQAHDLATIAQVADRLSSEADTRVEICAALREAVNGSFAVLFEVSRAGLRASAADGAMTPDARFDFDDRRSHVARAFRERSRSMVDGHTLADDDAGIASLGPCIAVLFEPVARSGRVQGVVVIGFDRTPKLDRRLSDMLTVLGASAATAIERMRELDKLRHQSMTDTLTGIPNRRGWNKALTPALELAGQTGNPVSVAVFDLDHFKLYNDSKGHLAGDALLHRTATAWSKQLRDCDVICRYGGEEFALLLPGCSLEDAAALAERLRTSMPAGQTCSAGVACWDGVESPTDLVLRADRALYRAKRDGRDRLVVDGDVPMPWSPSPRRADTAGQASTAR